MARCARSNPEEQELPTIRCMAKGIRRFHPRTRGRASSALGRNLLRGGVTAYLKSPLGLYAVSPRHEPVAIFEAHWADWDQRGRLVAAVGGRVLAGKLTRHSGLSWRQLAA